MKHLTTLSGQQKGNTMKEFKEFIKELNISASLESIVTFFMDNEWFNENIVMEHGKIMLSDIQAVKFLNIGDVLTVDIVGRSHPKPDIRVLENVLVMNRIRLSAAESTISLHL